MRKSHVPALAGLWLAAACSVPQSPAANSAYYSSMATDQLWAQHLRTNAPLETAYIEAELGARGQTARRTRYLGQTTASAYGRALYSRQSGVAVTGDKDCSDFASVAAAQRFFLASGGPVSDPHNLDGDGDGLACDWGATISGVARSKARKTAAAAPRRPSGPSSGTCHVGSRGGTYTITAGGYKDYDGC